MPVFVNVYVNVSNPVFICTYYVIFTIHNTILELPANVIELFNVDNIGGWPQEG